MTDRKKNSKIQYRKFIKEKGILSYLKNRNVGEADSAEKKQAIRKPVKYYILRYLGEFKDQKARLIFVVFMGFCSCVLGVAIPWTSKIMIDYVLPRKDVKLLALICAFLLVIATLHHVVSILQDYSNNVLCGRFVLNLKQRLMSHLHTLPLVELQKLKTGGIITRLQEDTEGAGNLIFNGLLSPFNAFTILILSMSSLLFISWRTTIVCIFFSPDVRGGLLFLLYNAPASAEPVRGKNRDKCESRGKLWRDTGCQKFFQRENDQKGLCSKDKPLVAKILV